MAVDIKQMTNLRLKINQLEREKKQSKDDVESVELLESDLPISVGDNLSVLLTFGPALLELVSVAVTVPDVFI